MRRSGLFAFVLLGSVWGCSGSGGDALAPSRDQTFAVQVTSLGAGTGRVHSLGASSLDCSMGAGASSCAVSLQQGSQLQLEAVPNSGSEFRGWELDASSCGVAPSCTLTVSGGLTLAARFEVAAPAGPSTSKSTFTAAPLTISPGET